MESDVLFGQQVDKGLLACLEKLGYGKLLSSLPHSSFYLEYGSDKCPQVLSGQINGISYDAEHGLLIMVNTPWLYWQGQVQALRYLLLRPESEQVLIILLEGQELVGQLVFAGRRLTSRRSGGLLD